MPLFKSIMKGFKKKKKRKSPNMPIDVTGLKDIDAALKLGGFKRVKNKAGKGVRVKKRKRK